MLSIYSADEKSALVQLISWRRFINGVSTVAMLTITLNVVHVSVCVCAFEGMNIASADALVPGVSIYSTYDISALA